MQQIDFYLRAKEMSKALSPIFKTINRSTVLPQLEAVRITKEGDKTIFTATDLETSIRLGFDLDAKKEFDFCMDHMLLRKFLSKSIDEVVRVCGDENKVWLESDSLKAHVTSFCSSEYPRIPVLDSDRKIFTIDASVLISEFTKALKFTSRDELRPALTGISIKDVKGYIQIAATDAHRLYWKKIKETPENLKGLDAIVPQKAVKIFLETFKKGDVKVSVDGQYINFFQESKSLTAHMVQSRYPDYMSVVPSYDFDFLMNRKQLIAFLNIAEDFINRSTYQINITVSEGLMEVDGDDVDFSVGFNYRAPVYELSSASGLPFSFSVNAKFLKEILSITKDDYVKISHSKTRTASIVLDGCALLMPVMTN